MKKFMKALAVFAAMAMLAGSFVSCSSDDDSSDSKPAATKYTCTNCGTEYATEAERDNCDKQAGCPKYVAEATKYKCDGCGTEYDTEAEKNNCAKQEGCPNYVAEAYSFTADFTKLNTTITGITVAAEDAKGKAKLKATEEVAFDEVAVLYSRSEGKLIRRAAGDTYSINYGNNSLAKAGASGNGQFTAEEAEVGKTIDFAQKIGDTQNRDGYVGVDLSKKSSIAATADVKVTFDFYTVANKDCSDDCGVVAVVDADGKVLASKTGLKLKTGAGSSEKETIEVTIKGGTKAYLLFSRNGCTKGGSSSGGIDVTGIKVEELTNN